MVTAKNPTINFRVIPERKRILKEFAAEIMATRPYWKEADVWKELMGITDEGVITNEMRRRLRERLRDAERPLLPRQEPERIMRDDESDSEPVALLATGSYPYDRYDLPTHTERLYPRRLPTPQTNKGPSNDDDNDK